MKPVTAIVFGTTWLDLFGLGIRYAQRKKTPFHVGIKFDMEDGAQVGFEGSYGKNGWIQFRYLDKIASYHGDITKTVREIVLNLSSEQIEELYIAAKEMTKSVERYTSKSTMVWKLLHERRGWPMWSTKNIVDCSEGLARLLFSIGIDLRDKENPIFDAMSPSEVWEAIKKWQAASA